MSWPFLGLFLLAVFSGFYTTRLGFSPVYIAVFFGFIVTLYSLLSNFIRIRQKDLLHFALVSMLAMAALSHIVFFHSLLQNAINFLIGPMVLVLIFLHRRNVSLHQVESLSKCFFWATAGLALIESAYRLSHPDFSFLVHAEQRGTTEDVAFYAYKYTSLMYVDSNFVGLQLVIFLAFMFGCNQIKTVFRWWHFVITFILICLTLSRASVFTSVVIFLYARFFGAKIGAKAVIVLLCSMFAVYFSSKFSLDGSLATKFDLLNNLSEFLIKHEFLIIAFGVGIGRAVDVLGMGAHNIFVTYLIELGLFLSLFVYIFWVWISIKFSPSRFLLIAWLVNGFSLTTFAVPYLYASLGLLLLFRINMTTRDVRCGPSLKS